ncbi:MAG: UDP-N-acetylmuramoyl-L-alanine--D-glutamate ligase [Cytophagia bacterium]|nr:MAG: UDP-N-acetylmuramoyl-L-alanine--D-glutamate ligase [Cytophagia bacterium]TAG43452.1 MAG: UDP-N-acetylmuramoyl-L-alanine--D-glutamate ligase [Cytophagia bacterium]
MNTNNKKIVILGGGESGIGAALLAKAKGFEVFVSDKNPLSPKYEQVLTDENILYEEGEHTEELILAAAEIIKSPGIPSNAAIVLKAKEAKIPIISEIEFASRYTKAKIIAITGSNGKTTTTLLTYHLLKSAGLNVGLAGNVGESWAKQLVKDEHDYWVLEVSSFQLDDCYQFTPDIAIILNVTPDHLDRYENNFQFYVDSKFKLVQNIKKENFFIYQKDNPAIAQELKKRIIGGQHFPISLSEVLDNGAYLKGQFLDFYDKKQKISFSMQTNEIHLKGKHNMVNVMASIQVCLRLGVAETALKEYFQSFHGVEHRLEEVETIDGVRFINDSKATNVDSVYYALDSFEEKVIWIAGGIDKGNDYNKIKDLVNKKVKALVCLGKDNSKLVDFFRDSVHIIYQTQDIRDATEQAFELSKNGEVVLLSPACASFDLFANYEERGKEFKKAVQKIHKISAMKGKGG